MEALSILLTWIHIACAIVFIGGMTVATFVLMPVLKTTLDYEQRHQFVVRFVPRARSIMRVVVASLFVSGVARIGLLHASEAGPFDSAQMGVFGAKLLFAATPLVIFLIAPKVLGKRSPEGLCCDPDAEGPSFKACGVMTTKGSLLHYAAIGGGMLAVLFAVILASMR